jgi:hypothetical protein
MFGTIDRTGVQFAPPQPAKAGCRISVKCLEVPQHLLLYLAFFCSIMAIIFSIQTHLSTDFVDLSEPIDAGLFFEKQWRIGISSWELCGLKQIVIDEILDGDIYSVIGPYSMEDVQRTLYPSRSSTKNTLAIIEDELDLDDDGLVSADFPYRDDDEILTAIPPEFWSCQTINIRSSDVNDMKWVISRVFLMVGTIFGVTASCFLVVLIISRAKTQANDEIKRAPKQHIQSYNGVGPRKENQHAAVQSLDTISTGYRPIASLFLITYLFQCVTFIFLDSEICKSHDCHISSGAISLLAACILWVMSGVLVYLMMRKIWNNQKVVRAYNKRRQKEFEASTFEQLADIDTSSWSSQQSSESSPSSPVLNELNDTRAF